MLRTHIFSENNRSVLIGWMLLDSIGWLIDGWMDGLIDITQRNQHSLPLTTQYQSV